MKPRWIVVGLIGLAVILLISVAIDLGDSPPAAEHQLAEPAESAAAEEPDAAEEASFAPQPPQPRPAPSQTPAPHQARPAPSQKPPPLQKRAALIITGKVEDAQGQPLENALLRWIPLGLGEAWQISSDAVMIDADASRIPQGPLREAFLSSRIVRSQPDGGYFFEFIDLPPRIGFVAATAPGYEIAMQRVEVLTEGQESQQQTLEAVLDFRLGFAGVISGAVRDRISGAGAQGMAVAARSLQPGVPPMMLGMAGHSFAAISDAEGRYSIQGLPPGEYWVAPKTGQSEYVSVSFQKGRKVILEAGSEISNLDFEVDRGGRISGRFLNAEKEPLQGVRCGAVPSNLASMFMSGGSSALELLGNRELTPHDGSFEFRGLPLQASYRIRGEVEGLAAASSPPVHLTEDDPQAKVEIVMTPGSMILGSVVHQDGRIAAGTKVFASLENRNPLDILSGGSIHHTQSDEQGNFELKNFTAGIYRLMAGEDASFMAHLASRGEDEAARRFVSVEVDGQRDVSGIVLTLDEADKSLIAGHVVDDLGEPFEGASVTVTIATKSITSAASAVSGADGAFQLQPRGKGPFQVEVQSGFSRVTLPKVEAGRQDLRISLSRPGFVSGRVIAPDGSALPTVSRLEARSYSSDDPQSEASRLLGQANSFATPAADGTFRIQAPAGQAQIIARVPGFATAYSKPVPVQPGGETANLEILLTQGALLLGTVVVKNGSPLEGAQVSVLLDESDLISQLRQSSPLGWMLSTSATSTDSQGHFEFPNLRPGSYSVQASHADHAPSETLQIDLEEGQRRQVRLEIVSGGSIFGLVLDGDLPQPGLAVWARSADSVSRTTASDDEGRFLIEGLPAGEYGLQVLNLFANRPSVLKSVQVHVSEGRSRHVEIDLSSGVRIYGSIQGGSPDANYQILLVRPGSVQPQDLASLEFAQASMMSAGSVLVRSKNEYEMRSIDPGSYSLEVYRLPDDLDDMNAYQSMERSPVYQQRIQLGERDLRVDIVIR